MLFNEPKLLKYLEAQFLHFTGIGFSALQRAEIAEMNPRPTGAQRVICFSALQRAEIAEIMETGRLRVYAQQVSVLFNEPKLLKYCTFGTWTAISFGFSALQRAEIAEIENEFSKLVLLMKFQCSSTSRNC